MAGFSTPSPPPRVRTPQTPKHGYSDPWEPYSPRKSARISQQQLASNRTPSPRSSATSRSSSRKSAVDSFSTPFQSPQKKRSPAMDSVRRVSGNLTAESAADAAAQLGIAPTSQPRFTTGRGASSRSAMLPTPAKTPRKQPNEKLASASESVARTLFTGDDALADPSKQKKPKKYSGLGLDSFRAEDAEEPIPIFTDSCERIPEVDTSAENPFYVADQSSTTAPVPDPPKRRSTKRKTIVIPGEGRVDIQEAIKRDDGAIYVFRGKRIWKSSGDPNPGDQLEVDGEGFPDDILGNPAHRRVTRASVKPKLLFPETHKGKGVAKYSTEDEEAATDIEDHVLSKGAEEDLLETPPNDKTPGTPQVPLFAPASPPTTARVTRTSKKVDDAPVPRSRSGKSISPFDNWRRSKSSKSHGQKRKGEALPNEGAPKRQRA